MPIVASELTADKNTFFDNMLEIYVREGFGGKCAVDGIFLAYLSPFTYQPPQDDDSRPPWDGSHPNRSKRPNAPSTAHPLMYLVLIGHVRSIWQRKIRQNIPQHLLSSALHAVVSKNAVVTAAWRWWLLQLMWPITTASFVMNRSMSIYVRRLEQKMLWITCSWQNLSLWRYRSGETVFVRHWRRLRGGLLAWKSIQPLILCFGTFLWIYQMVSKQSIVKKDN